MKTSSTKKMVNPSTNPKLIALSGVKNKVEFLKKNWIKEKFDVEFGELTQTNVARCIGCAFQSVSIHWKNPEEKAETIEKQTAVVKVIETVDKTIMDDEPQKRVVSYSTETSAKSLKDLYFELGEAHGQLEEAQAKIVSIESEIQLQRVAVI